jgi:xanthosine phosphorylase
MSAPHEAAAVLRERASGLAPHLAIVAGSGLGAVADAVEVRAVVPYADLPGFPRPTVAGHAGEAVLGRLGGVDVVVLRGRAHLYEGTAPEDVRTPIRALHALGVRTVVLTNAAGSLRPEVGPGRLVALSDHINMTGVSVLAGPNDEAWGPRFPPMGAVYDAGLRAVLGRAADDEGIALAEGVYLGVLGPAFETPAEIRAFRTLGADAVGMSTVHEATVAVHCGLRVVGISAITNLAEGLGDEPLSHAGTLQSAGDAGADLARLLARAAGGLA